MPAGAALSLLISPVPSMQRVLHIHKALFKEREGIWDLQRENLLFTGMIRFPGGKHCLSWTTGGMADGRKHEPRAEACVRRAGATHPGFRDPAGTSVVRS